VLSPEKKRSGREADQSFPFSVDVKKEWIYTSLPPFPFIFTFATHCVLFEVDITRFLLGLCQTVLTSTLREAQTELFIAVVIDVTDGNVVLFGPLLQGFEAFAADIGQMLIS
jgi:hypothetical protein